MCAEKKSVNCKARKKQLRMNQGKPQKFVKLECLRGFAAIYVVLHHNVKFSYDFLGIDLGELFRFGQEAVILFFLISGFVIHYSYSRDPSQSFSKYFKKRALRIYVPLILVFLIGYLLESAATGSANIIDFRVLMLNLAMLQDWAFARPNTIVEPFLGNTPLWSLGYEWWFYMLFFPTMLLIQRMGVKYYHVHLCCIVATLVYCLYPYFIPRILSYFSIWWVGVLLAVNYLDGKELNVRNCIWSIGTLSVISGIYACVSVISLNSGESFSLGIHPFIELRHFSFALFVLCMAIVWCRFHWRFFELLFRPFLVFAPISYVVYISHYYLVTNASYLSVINNRIIELIIYTVILLAISWIIELRIYPMVISMLRR